MRSRTIGAPYPSGYLCRCIYGMASIAPERPAVARDEAFELLYRRYVKDVYRYALALLRNPADAEDVVQTTFLNAYRAFKRGEKPSKPQNWLIKIAHNAARTRYAASMRRVKEVPLEDHADQLSVPEEDKPDVEAVLDALGRLPLNQRAALVMRELEGRTYAEIADTLGVSIPAVETLIFRARRALRMKASTVRVLGLVQLPSSLAQLLDSSSELAVGGSAALGTGFLVKALVAVVAGAVATGVAADRTYRAHAQPRAVAAAAASTHSERALRIHMQTAGAAPRTRVARRATAHLSGSLARSIRRRAEDASRPQTVSASASEQKGSASASTTAARSSASSPTSSNPTATVSSATNVVASAADQVTAAVPAPPVSVPELPSVPPVSVPPPPSPPPLP